VSAFTLPDIFLFAATVATAAIAQAITGFGFTILALGLLGFWMDLRTASLVLAPAGFVLNLLLVLRLRAHFSWRGLVPLAVAGLVGVPLGAMLLFQVSPRFLEFLLAGLMLAQAFQGLLIVRPVTPRSWHPVAAGIPCGFTGGIITGAFGAGGPPIVSFLLNRPLNRFQYIASLQMLFALFAGVRLVQFLLLGRFARSQLILLAPGVAAAVAGASIGLYLLKRLSDQGARLIVLWFVLACGLRYLWVAW
jgi:uncharacterized membrane protein YfcA